MPQTSGGRSVLHCHMGPFAPSARWNTYALAPVILAAARSRAEGEGWVWTARPSIHGLAGSNAQCAAHMRAQGRSPSRRRACDL